MSASRAKKIAGSSSRAARARAALSMPGSASSIAASLLNPIPCSRLAPPLPPRAGDRLVRALVISLLVVALLVVVLVRAQLDVIQNDAEDSCADLAQHLLRAPRDLPRTLAAADDQQHAVDHRGYKDAVGEGGDRRRVYDDEVEGGR